eukprot:COSAG02_NODE_8410_length_2582_cov_3.531212_1_plen_59_part_10
MGGLGRIGGVFGRGDAGGSAMVNVAFSRCGDAALGRGGANCSASKTIISFCMRSSSSAD